MSGTDVRPGPAEAEVRIRDEIGKRLGDASSLPMLPEAAAQVISRGSDPDVEVEEIAELVKRDQALSAHVFRFTNSAMGGAAVPITSLQFAISRLGLKRIREMALIVSCRTRIFKVDGRESQIRALFRHALASGVWAQEIARMRRLSVEEAFTAGLLHDVGRPVIMQLLVDLEKEGLVLESPRQSRLADEMHADVGARLVEAWGLPTRLREIIRAHHDPTLSAEDCQTMARVIRLADDFGHLDLDGDPEAEQKLTEHPELAPLNFYEEDLAELIGRREKVKDMVEASE